MNLLGLKLMSYTAATERMLVYNENERASSAFRALKRNSAR